MAEYRGTERGQAARFAYDASESGRAKQAAYRCSESGKVKRFARDHSEEARAKRAAYKQTPRGRAVQRDADSRYRGTVKGFLAQVRKVANQRGDR